jgi:hypothetical protein
MDIILVLVGLAGIMLLALMAWLVRAVRSRQWMSALGLAGGVGAIAGLSLIILLPLYLDSHLPDSALEPLPQSAVKIEAEGLQAVFQGKAHRGILYDLERKTWIWYEENHADDGTIAGLGGLLTGPETWSWSGIWAVEGQEICRTYGERFHCGHVFLTDDGYVETDHDGRVDMQFQVLPDAQYVTGTARLLDQNDIRNELIGQALLVYQSDPAFHAHFQGNEANLFVQRGIGHAHYNRYEEGTYGLEGDQLCLMQTFDLPSQCLSVYHLGDEYAFARNDGRIVLGGTLDAVSQDTAQE